MILAFLKVILSMRLLLPVSEVLPGCKVRPPQPTGLFSQYLPKSSAFRQKHGKGKLLDTNKLLIPRSYFFRKKGAKSYALKVVSLYLPISFFSGKKISRPRFPPQKAKDPRKIMWSTRFNKTPTIDNKRANITRSEV